MKKKILIGLAVIGASVAVLGGCGGSTEKDSDKTESATNSSKAINPNDIKYNDIEEIGVKFKVPATWSKTTEGDQIFFREGDSENFIFYGIYDYTNDTVSNYFKGESNAMENDSNATILEDNVYELPTDKNVLAHRIRFTSNNNPNAEAETCTIITKDGKAIVMGFVKDISGNKNDYSEVYDYIFNNIKVDENAVAKESEITSAATTTLETTTATVQATTKLFDEYFFDNNLRFGMAFEEAKDVMKQNIESTIGLNNEAIPGTAGLITRTDSDDVHRYCYEFPDAKLNKYYAEFIYPSVEKYEKIKQELIKRFGECTDEKYIWTDETYKDEPNTALKYGYLEIYATWNNQEKVNYRIRCNGENITVYALDKSINNTI